jgi:hypothetical protein
VRVRRVITAAALAATVATGLTACQAQVGAAAFVGKTRISESDVTKYLSPSATTFTATNSDGSTQSVNPKAFVLEYLIRVSLLDKTLAQSKGGTPTAAELAAAKATVLQGGSDAQLSSELTADGFTTAFEPLYIQATVQLEVLASRLQDTTGAATLAAIAKADAPVRVNDRYGTWQASQLSLVTAGTPSFLKSVALVPND